MSQGNRNLGEGRAAAARDLSHAKPALTRGSDWWLLLHAAAVLLGLLAGSLTAFRVINWMFGRDIRINSAVALLIAVPVCMVGGIVIATKVVGALRRRAQSRARPPVASETQHP